MRKGYLRETDLKSLTEEDRTLQSSEMGEFQKVKKRKWEEPR